MLNYNPPVGEMISETARKIVALANAMNEAVSAEFNDVKLVANPGDSATRITKFYSSEIERRAREWRESPEGRRAAQEEKERRRALQAQMDEAMIELLTLNFSDFNAVITWLEKICDPSNYIGMKVPYKKIVDTFRRHGYKPNVNIDGDFDGDDEESFARYIIGQALNCLQKVYAIHGVIHKFADDWRKQFGYA